MRLHITLTGDVTVAGRDDVEPQVVSGPARIVLAALVLERPTGVTRERLAGIVWPEAMPRTWASALRTHVSRARSALIRAVGTAGEVVTAGDLGYQLAVPAGVDLVVDIDEAAEALREARAALADRPRDRREPGGRGRVAGASPRPPRTSREPGPTTSAPASRTSWSGRCQVASEAATALGDPVRAVAAAEEATQRAPVNEAGHRALMAALDAAGNRAEALRAYQRARRVLADQLGVDPSEDTEAAYLALLGPTPAARPRTEPDSRGPALVPEGGGGRRPVPFVGRTAELELLARAGSGRRAAHGTSSS